MHSGPSGVHVRDFGTTGFEIAGATTAIVPRPCIRADLPDLRSGSQPRSLRHERARAGQRGRGRAARTPPGRSRVPPAS